ncbi:MAG: hypothetical protein JNK48_30625 [Bryobacterales bacterium]|nr:hypothetical protein [Bryobacterales bacterium]
MKRRTFLATAALAGCASKPQPGFSGFAFVANEEGKAIAAVDLTALAVVRHLRLDHAPTKLLSDGSRKMVYALTPENGMLHEISSGKLQRERWVSLGGHPLDMRLSSKGGSIWVLLDEPRQLVEVTFGQLEVARRIALPEQPVSFDVSIEQPRAVVSFGEVAQVAAIDLEAGRLARVDCGSPLGLVRFRKDGRQWITAHRDPRISFYDTASSKLVVRLPLAMRPDHFCFKDNGGELFVTGEGSDGVAIVFPYWTEVAETILAGSGPAEMAASPINKATPELLFVTNPKAGQLSIIHIETRKLVASLQMGAEPSQVVITPDNQYILVLNQRSGDMAVLTQSAARRAKYPTLLTMVPVGSKPVSAVVQAV